MGYYEIRDTRGQRIDGGTFSSDADAIRWYNNDVWPGWLYRKSGASFVAVNTNFSQPDD